MTRHMFPIVSYILGFGFLCSSIIGCKTETKRQKTIKVKEMEFQGEQPTMQEVSVLLEAHTELNAIDLINWEAYPYQPMVKFRIGHHNNQIWLKFYVDEAHVLAQRTTTNSATHKDSCVEFFMDPVQNGNYYNFEFNAIGVTHLAYGPSGKERVFVDPEVIEKQIKIESSLGKEPFLERSSPMSWEMTVVIPIETFSFTKNISLKGLYSKANFYKCGDDTSIPHYLSWNPVDTEKPDFHQPSFFGNLVFE